MKRKWIILIVAAVIVILFAISAFLALTKESPEVEISLAREKLTEAALMRSAKYAREHYERAGSYYDSAMLAWTGENKRFILLRDYQQIIKYAEKSVEYSEHAITVALRYISKTEADLGTRIANIERDIAEFEKKYGDFPFSKTYNNQLSKSKLQYHEGVLAFNNNNFSHSISKLDSSEELIKRLHHVYEQKLEDYFDHYDEWNSWLKKAIANSKKDRAYCIIVDKMARDCLLYKNGMLMKSFDAELGPNWIGDKEQQGDKRTPEGFYMITKKKSGSETRFYKALLLNYPNEEDMARFNDNKRNGVISANARVGNLIEIHGQGGRGVDWTDGCIALKNDDMDELYRACQAGTPVIIVGSAKSLKEVLQTRK